MFSVNLQGRARRLRLVCMLSCLLALSFSGCQGSLPEDGPAATLDTAGGLTEETITISSLFYEDVDETRIRELAAMFREEHPTVEIRLQFVGAGPLIEFEPSTADVVEVWEPWLSVLREEGYIIALDPFIELDNTFNREDYYPTALGTATIERQVWAIPYGLDTQVMFYNQDLFDQYGVPYPEEGWTWDDFLATALALRNVEAGVYGYANIGTYFSVLQFLHLYGTGVWADNQNLTQLTLDDPLTIEAMQWYGDLYHEYDVAMPLPQAAGQDDALMEAVLGGKVGMWSCVYSFHGGKDITWSREWPMRWGVVTFPRPAVSTARAMAGDMYFQGYAISSGTEHTDTAWQWISLLSKELRTMMMPVRRSLATSPAYEQLVGHEVAAVGRIVLEDGEACPPSMFGHSLTALHVLNEAIQQIERDQMTPEEAMQWAQQQAEERLGRGESPFRD